MPKIPIRNLGQVGIVTDTNSYNLPINAFSSGVNVRFDDGKIKRAPIFRKVKDSLGFTPRFAFGLIPSTGFDSVVMVSDDFQIKEYQSGAVTDRSGSISGSTSPLPFTGTTLSNVFYINREDRVPVYRLANGTNFADLPNWDATHKTKSLRSYKDFLIALNTTEGTTSFPTRVRFSDITTVNNVPGSWDATDTTKSAGFNDISELKTEIMDGGTLGANFIIYSRDQVHQMEFVGGTFIFNFRRLFTDAGIINTNCWVEVEGKHYVFGNEDIYVHDGTTKQSISDQRVKNFIYSGLNAANADRCFVQHNPSLNEIYFCYQSGDSLVAFPNADRCNRAAVYNYRSDTFSFYDLPNVSSGTIANVDSIETYATATGLTYNLTGGSYYDQQDSFNRHTLMVGEDITADGITSDKLYAIDLSDEGSVAFQIDTEATKPALVERTGIDLDETGTDLSGYKVITAMYPQADTTNTANTQLTVSFGAADLPRNTPTYATSSDFDVAVDTKIDSRAAGRYLSYKVEVSDNKDFSFSGYDLDITITGSR
jgi:hypothetical protein